MKYYRNSTERRIENSGIIRPCELKKKLAARINNKSFERGEISDRWPGFLKSSMQDAKGRKTRGIRVLLVIRVKNVN